MFCVKSRMHLHTAQTTYLPYEWEQSYRNAKDIWNKWCCCEKVEVWTLWNVSFSVQQDLAETANSNKDLCNKLAEQQQDKYNSLQTPPPPEVAEEIEKLKSRQIELDTQLADNTDLLDDAEQLREDFHEKIAELEEMLNDTANHLQEPIYNVPDSKRVNDVSRLLSVPMT